MLNWNSVCWHPLTLQALGARLPSQSAIDRSSSFREVPCSRVSHLRSSLPDAASSSWATTPAPNGAREIASPGPSCHPSTTNIWGSPGHSGKTSLCLLLRTHALCTKYSGIIRTPLISESVSPVSEARLRVSPSATCLLLKQPPTKTIHPRANQYPPTSARNDNQLSSAAPYYRTNITVLLCLC
jgi:hypothetical protein